MGSAYNKRNWIKVDAKRDEEAQRLLTTEKTGIKNMCLCYVVWQDNILK